MEVRRRGEAAGVRAETFTRRVDAYSGLGAARTAGWGCGCGCSAAGADSGRSPTPAGFGRRYRVKRRGLVAPALCREGAGLRAGCAGWRAANTGFGPASQGQRPCRRWSFRVRRCDPQRWNGFSGEGSHRRIADSLHSLLNVGDQIEAPAQRIRCVRRVGRAGRVIRSGEERRPSRPPQVQSATIPSNRVEPEVSGNPDPLPRAAVRHRCGGRVPRPCRRTRRANRAHSTRRARNREGGTCSDSGR
jgi:hypothetical protein